MKFSQVFFTVLSAAPSFSAPVVGESVSASHYQSLSDDLSPYLAKKDSATDEIQNLLSTFNSQISNVFSLVDPIASSSSNPFSQIMGSNILSHFVQSTSAELNQTIVPQILKEFESLPSSTISEFVDSLTHLTSLTSNFNVDSSGLQNIISEIESKIPQHSKRAADLSSIFDAINGAHQSQNTLNDQFSGLGTNSTSEINQFITGFESQIKTVVNTLETVFNSFFGGLAKQFSNTLIGPFMQTATQGGEELVSKLEQVASNGIDTNGLSSLVSSFEDLISLGQKSNVDVSGLSNVTQGITSLFDKLA